MGTASLNVLDTVSQKGRWDDNALAPQYDDEGRTLWRRALPGTDVQRRLAAILAADVVGYSRLMSMDEEGTLARLKATRRETIDPLIVGNRGRLVKLTGDGALVEFASAVDAVRCAIAIQDAIADAHETSLPRSTFCFGSESTSAT
jgi:Adenylate cyclase, family 3 (some proteins contain HAMP domain)